MVKVYFCSSENKQSIIDYFNSLYIVVLKSFDKKLEEEENRKDVDTSVIGYVTSNLENVYDDKFRDFFSKEFVTTIEKVRHETVKDHSEKCVIRCVFDILFKYYIDFDVGISYYCCNGKEYISLQKEILSDLSWKIRSSTSLESGDHRTKSLGSSFSLSGLRLS